MDLRIRALRSDDSNALAQLCEQLGYPVSPDNLLRRLKSSLHLPHNRHLVATTAEDIPIAWMHLLRVDNLDVEPGIEVVALVVHSDWRGHGVGRNLMTEAEKWACSLGFRSVFLRSQVFRTGAHRFYESLGFQKTKNSFQYCKGLTLSQETEFISPEFQKK